MPKYGLLPPFLCIFALIYSKPYQYPASECKNRDYGTHYIIVLKRKPSQETRDGSPSPNRGKGQFSKRKRQEGDKGDRERQGTVLRPLSPNRGRKRQRTVPCLPNVPKAGAHLAPSIGIPFSSRMMLSDTILYLPVLRKYLTHTSNLLFMVIA